MVLVFLLIAFVIIILVSHCLCVLCCHLYCSWIYFFLNLFLRFLHLLLDCIKLIKLVSVYVYLQEVFLNEVKFVM